jgi:hypothetical protein
MRFVQYNDLIQNLATNAVRKSREYFWAFLSAPEGKVGPMVVGDAPIRL